MLTSVGQISVVHRESEKAEEMVNDLIKTDSGLEDMLETDNQDVFGPQTASTFVLYQHDISRHQTLYQVKKSSRDIRVNFVCRFRL